jgi:hypothetical protein
MDIYKCPTEVYIEVRPKSRRTRRRRRSYYVRSKKNYRGYKRSEMLTARAPINRIANKVGFPNEIFTRLIYEDRVALSFSVAGFDTWSFAMNGLYDPDLDAIGHQPRFLTNMHQYIEVIEFMQQR